MFSFSEVSSRISVKITPEIPASIFLEIIAWISPGNPSEIPPTIFPTISSRILSRIPRYFEVRYVITREDCMPFG